MISLCSSLMSLKISFWFAISSLSPAFRSYQILNVLQHVIRSCQAAAVEDPKKRSKYDIQVGQELKKRKRRQRTLSFLSFLLLQKQKRMNEKEREAKASIQRFHLQVPKLDASKTHVQTRSRSSTLPCLPFSPRGYRPATPTSLNRRMSNTSLHSPHNYKNVTLPATSFSYPSNIKPPPPFSSSSPVVSTSKNQSRATTSNSTYTINKDYKRQPNSMTNSIQQFLDGMLALLMGITLTGALCFSDYKATFALFIAFFVCFNEGVTKIAKRYPKVFFPYLIPSFSFRCRFAVLCFSSFSFLFLSG